MRWDAAREASRRVLPKRRVMHGSVGEPLERVGDMTIAKALFACRKCGHHECSCKRPCFFCRFTDCQCYEPMPGSTVVGAVVAVEDGIATVQIGETSSAQAAPPPIPLPDSELDHWRVLVSEAMKSATWNF